MNPFQAFQTKNEFQAFDPQRIGGILKSGDGVQMSVSSYGTTFKKQSLAEMVIFPTKTAPMLHFWWGSLEDRRHPSV